ncbi:FH1/FH2 domain-containing protein 3-like [Diaphorina citri]|uniref:FH1/FH2 domain-containing protein 3-like n=1 Tax=Diaphorina citri TaxID=121845 RepID=A0A3Q0J7W3_DIACI|nr:FH1/FH2 domain-containing protein 3-like [Diaphorina citri]
MLYVDGMTGIMDHPPTVQWLYVLVASKFRLVIKTALKLLLIFVEYVESNCFLLIQAVHAVDNSNGEPPWSNIMRLLTDRDSTDTELLIYAMSLLNKTLNGIPDQDSYYDQVDALEEQGIAAVIRRYMSKPGTDLDLLRQFQIYEAVLQHEDGEDKGTPLRQLDEAIRKTLRNRKSLTPWAPQCKHASSNIPVQSISFDWICRIVGVRHDFFPNDIDNWEWALEIKGFRCGEKQLMDISNDSSDSDKSKSYLSNGSNGRISNASNAKGLDGHISNGSDGHISNRSNGHISNGSNGHISNGHYSDGHLSNRSNGHISNGSTGHISNNSNGHSNGHYSDGHLSNGHISNGSKGHYSDGHLSNKSNGHISNGSNGHYSDGHLSNSRLSNSHISSHLPEGHISKEHVISDGHISNGHMSDEPVSNGHISNGHISDELMAPSRLSNAHISSNGYASSDNILSSDENNSLKNKRECSVKDLTQKLSNLHAPNDKLNNNNNIVGEMKGIISKAKEGLAKSQSRGELKSPTGESLAKVPAMEIKKSETDLHWEELLKSTTKSLVLCDLDFSDLKSDEDRDILAPANVANGVPPPPPPCGVLPPPNPMGMGAPPPVPNLLNQKSNINKTKKTVKLFWKEVREDPIVISKLKSVLIWDELSPVKVDTQKLEHLFESRAKDLISKLHRGVDAWVGQLVDRVEGCPSEGPCDEGSRRACRDVTVDADIRLGHLEEFEMKAGVGALEWNLEFLICLLGGCQGLVVESCVDGINSGECVSDDILAAWDVLNVSIFLNGTEVKGFQIEYLTKVPEVKDTVHKHSLLHHLCDLVLHQFPQSTDLYSEIGPVTRASKVDFDELASSLRRMEMECKASFDYLKLIIKHDGSATSVKVNYVARKTELMQNSDNYWNLRTQILPLHSMKKASHRERNKTRGKMITEVSKLRSQEDRADAELRQLLEPENTDPTSPLNGTLTWRPRRKESGK